MSAIREGIGRLIPLIADYSLANNSYESRTNKAHNNDTTNGNINIQPINSNINQESTRRRSANSNTSRRSTLTETIVESLINGGKANCLPTCLLAATLIASLLNTFLLSFVVKSIQLNDKGFINGEVTWDDQLTSTILGLSTKLPGKSISLKSIESIDDKPLRLEKWSDNNIDLTYDEQRSGKKFESNVASNVFISNTHVISQTPSMEGFKSNYIAINENSHVDQKSDSKQKIALELGAQLLVLNLINAREIVLKNQTSNKWLNNNLLDSSRKVNDQFDEKIKPLLEFQSEQRSITLPLEDKLSSSSLTSGSLIVEEELKSPEISGCLEKNLDVQIRDGNLTCRSEETMRLMSRSGGAKISTLEELVLTAPSLIFSAKNMYIPNGIQFFDSKPKANSKDSGVLTQSNTREQKQQDSSSSHRDPSDALEAYNLVVVNGILTAAA